MAMHGAGLLLKRAGREFVRNLLWMLVVFGLLAAILIFAAHLPLLGVLAFGGVLVSVMAAIVTVVVLWSGAHDESFLRGHNYPASPHEGGGLDHWPGGGWDGGGGGDGGGGDA